jgi:hypothetical protein
LTEAARPDVYSDTKYFLISSFSRMLYFAFLEYAIFCASALSATSGLALLHFQILKGNSRWFIFRKNNIPIPCDYFFISRVDFFGGFR